MERVVKFVTVLWHAIFVLFEWNSQLKLSPLEKAHYFNVKFGISAYSKKFIVYEKIEKTF